jgi:hypothetical protein
MDTLSRLVPFTRDVFLGELERYNYAIWPVQIAAYLLVFLMLWSALRPFSGSGRLIAAVLAAAWLWTGVAYYILHQSQINWAAWAMGVVFILQGLAFAVTGAVLGRLDFRFSGDAAGWTGVILIAAAAILYPLIGILTDQGWPRVPLVGVAPGPTLAWTLGMLLLAIPRAPWHLLIIPLLWSVAGAAGALLLDMPQNFLLPVAAVLTIVLTIRKAGGTAAQSSC